MSVRVAGGPPGGIAVCRHFGLRTGLVDPWWCAGERGPPPCAGGAACLPPSPRRPRCVVPRGAGRALVALCNNQPMHGIDPLYVGARPPGSTRGSRESRAS